MPLPGIVNPSLTHVIMADLVRNDINDLDASAYRLTDATIQREIDRAVDRYSFVAPFWLASQLPTISGSRLYPTPAGAWWVERVEYPLDHWPKRFIPFRETGSALIAPPSSAPAAATDGTGILSGTYQWAVTFLTPGGGETTPSPIVTATITAAHEAALSNIPIGPYGVVDRRLYRSSSGGSQLKLVGPIGDNSSTTYTDNTADGSLGANAPTTNSTQGIPLFELQLQPDSLPQTTTDWLEVTAAYKHELDASGTTIPEQHWDAISLGAQAFSLFSYLGATNDNFDYVDGQFRDKVDDTAAPKAWLAHAQHIFVQFTQRLTEIRRQLEDSVIQTRGWGDKPYRWDRL